MDKSNYRNMWVHVEHDGEKIHPVTLELCSEIRKLCDQSGDKLIAVSAGELPESELDKLRDCGADGVMVEMHPDPLHARCDGAQALLPEELAALSQRLHAVREACR